MNQRADWRERWDGLAKSTGTTCRGIVTSAAMNISHVAIKRAFDDMKEGITHGSFFKVLEPYKDFDANLIEEVNQVRRYRNWVAHGRRTEQPAAVNPTTAYGPLKRFLNHLGA